MKVAWAVLGTMLVTLLLVNVARSHDRLTAEQIQQMKQNGTYDERVGRILTLQQHKMAEGRRERAVYKVRRAALEASGLSEADAAHALSGGPQMAFPFVKQPELKSTGTVRTLTLLVDFKDHKADTELPGMTVQGIRDNIYGNGTSAAQAFKPYESLHAYYHRASEQKVDVQGDVLDWYHFPDNRATYQSATAPPGPNRLQRQAKLDNAAIFKMLSNVLHDADATHDFSQYDNDHDGDIDLVTMIYVGPDTGWGSFWWAYRWEFFVPEAGEDANKFDGVRARQFVFQFASRRGPNGSDFDPKTQMHEMGHAFGLADYYDYDNTMGPSGGVGGLDMMDSNWGNHNAFSRWLLDWVKPVPLGSGSPAVRQLVASGQVGNGTKAIAIFPGIVDSSAPSQEMFIVENRSRVGNDGGIAHTPTDGLLVWHIDATVNGAGDDFKYDNSYTDRKMIRLIRADSADDFGESDLASAGTYYAPGKVFTPNSVPNSNSYSGLPTGISLDGISGTGATISAKLGFLSVIGPSPAPQPAIGNAPAPVTNFASASTRTRDLLLGGPTSTNIHLDEIEAIDKLFSESTPAQLAELWSGAVAGKLTADPSPSGKNTQATLVAQSLLANWAAKDGKGAVDALLKVPMGGFVKRMYPRVMSAWARNAPIKAAEWYLKDENKELRGSKNLSAGADFAHEVFEASLIAGKIDIVKNLDELVHVPEVLGAVEGLHHGAENFENGANQLKNDLKSLIKNKDLVEAFNAAKEASGSIKDLKKKQQFQEFIKGRN